MQWENKNVQAKVVYLRKENKHTIPAWNYCKTQLREWTIRSISFPRDIAPCSGTWASRSDEAPQVSTMDSEDNTLVNSRLFPSYIVLEKELVFLCHSLESFALLVLFRNLYSAYRWVRYQYSLQRRILCYLYCLHLLPSLGHLKVRCMNIKCTNIGPTGKINPETS